MPFAAALLPTLPPLSPLAANVFQKLDPRALKQAGVIVGDAIASADGRERRVADADRAIATLPLVRDLQIRASEQTPIPESHAAVRADFVELVRALVLAARGLPRAGARRAQGHPRASELARVSIGLPVFAAHRQVLLCTDTRRLTSGFGLHCDASTLHCALRRVCNLVGAAYLAREDAAIGQATRQIAIAAAVRERKLRASALEKTEIFVSNVVGAADGRELRATDAAWALGTRAFGEEHVKI